MPAPITDLADWDAQHPVCLFCLDKRHPDTGEHIPPYHDLCIGRSSRRWCECPCPWMYRDEDK